MRKVDEAKEKINKMLEGGEEAGDREREPQRERERERERGEREREREPQSGSGVAQGKRQDGPLSEGEERDDDDYERWGEGEGGDSANNKVG